MSSAGRLAHPSSFTLLGARCEDGHPGLLVSSETVSEGRSVAGRGPTTRYSSSEAPPALLNIRGGATARARPAPLPVTHRLSMIFVISTPPSASKPPSARSGSESSFPARGWIPRRPPKRRTHRLTVSTGTKLGGHAAATPPARAPSPLGARWLGAAAAARRGWRGQGSAGGRGTRASLTAPASSSPPTSRTAR